MSNREVSLARTPCNPTIPTRGSRLASIRSTSTPRRKRLNTQSKRTASRRPRRRSHRQVGSSALGREEGETSQTCRLSMRKGSSTMPSTTESGARGESTRRLPWRISPAERLLERNPISPQRRRRICGRDGARRARTRRTSRTDYWRTSPIRSLRTSTSSIWSPSSTAERPPQSSRRSSRVQRRK